MTYCAVIGSGNIGTDLMIKILRRSKTLELKAFVGIDEKSDGLQKAARLGIPITHEGVLGLTKMKDWDKIEIIFDATSAKAHVANYEVIKKYPNKKMVDLTPAAIGPYIVPAVNLAFAPKNLDNVNMVTCGGQATIPMVAAVSQVAKVHYAEIIASVASKSAGPGTRSNVDEFTETTARAVEKIGGATRGKAIVILNPAEPPIIMRDTIYTLSDFIETKKIQDSIHSMIAKVQAYVPGYRLKNILFEEIHPEQAVEIEGIGKHLQLEKELKANYNIGTNYYNYNLNVIHKMKELYIQDVTLRDGMHPLRHQFTISQVQQIAKELDEAGVDAIEVTHGDGLTGSSFNYGFGKQTDWEWIAAAKEVIKRAQLTILLIPGIGTIRDLKQANQLGATSVRVATHCTEADISAQHISAARNLDMDVSGFLMMAHLNSPQGLVEQAKLMESYGAKCVYVTDSAGALTMNDVRERVRAIRQALKPETQVGIHCHNNLGLGIANTLIGIEEGAYRADASLTGLGAGAGNAILEVLIAVLLKMNYPLKCNLFKLMDVADDMVRPLQERPVRLDRETLSLGYAGVYSSFLLHAERAAKKFNLDAREILLELGKRKMVGGQEDMIMDVAMDLKK
ncbi:hypothetical protein CHS0354_000649 [Potamilus streckersoni]|uniref:4-hydroxy-2-oxohexanoate aldolase n=1 Tax=Potamilus streckersoni TaxID=2493646 RepID=A0AAE0T7Y6_9BIVA|nr:hypothetical protein CHS0354_000649 [Potamilus streckersoni]